MKTLTHQDLTDLVEGAAIFSGGGGGDPLVGFNIVEKLIENRCQARLIDAAEIPDDEILVDFACVGATASVAYHGDAAVKTLEAVEGFLKKKAYAIVPAELGGFSTMAAIDVAARHGIAVVDADGAGRAVPEMQLQVYTMEKNTAAVAIAVADIDAQNITMKRVNDSKMAEEIARKLAIERNQTVYVARSSLTGRKVKTSSVLNSLSASLRIGVLLRKAVDPLSAVLRETNSFLLFEGVVSSVERETKHGFTLTELKIDGVHGSLGSKLELKAKNEFLIAYRNGKLAAMAPDIITTVSAETCKCVPAEKITEDNRLMVIAIPAPAKWRNAKGLILWHEVLQRSGIMENYVPVEKLIE